jgi:hypothetical protein
VSKGKFVSYAHGKEAVMLITSRFWAGILLGVLSISSFAALGAAGREQVPFAPPAVAKDETNVFVIRESGFKGATRGVWIAANKNVVADLPSDSHVLIKLKSGMNVIHAVQELKGFGYFPVDNRPGETVYLNLLYKKGEMKEVSAAEAMPLIKKTEQVELLPEVRPNTALDDITINPGKLGLNIMEATDAALEPNDRSAVITFLRVENVFKDHRYDVWSDTGYVGSLIGGQYLNVRVTPGTHTFLSKAQNYSVLKADVAAGKHYYVEMVGDMLMFQQLVKLLPVDPDKDAKKIKALKKLTHLALNSSTLETDIVKPRIQAGYAFLADVRQKIAEGKVAMRELLPTQGR